MRVRGEAEKTSQLSALFCSLKIILRKKLKSLRELWQRVPVRRCTQPSQSLAEKGGMPTRQATDERQSDCPVPQRAHSVQSQRDECSPVSPLACTTPSPLCRVAFLRSTPRDLSRTVGTR